MPGTVTPLRKFEPTIAVPLDGERAAASAPGSPTTVVTLNEVVQQLSNLAMFAAAATPVGKPIGLKSSVTASGTNRYYALEVRHIAIERFDGSGILDLFAGTTTTLTLTGGTADSEGFIYAKNNAGSLELVQSSEIPDADGRNPSDARLWYLSSFLTDEAGRAIPQEQAGGSYCLYGTTNSIKWGGADVTTPGSTVVAVRVPSTARIAKGILFSGGGIGTISSSKFARVLARQGGVDMAVVITHTWGVGFIPPAGQHSTFEVPVEGAVSVYEATVFITDATIYAYVYTRGWCE